MPPSRPSVPARLRWALAVLDPQPDEQLLEVGCGPGVLASLICARLGTGRLLTLDRSAVAVRRTRERNAEQLAAGRLGVQQADLADAELPAASLDQALAVDVNVFWVRDPGPELGVLLRALRPGGRLHLLYGTGPTPAARITGTVADQLVRHGFVEVEPRESPAGCGVSARTPPTRP